jgi:hypothetical protein
MIFPLMLSMYSKLLKAGRTGAFSELLNSKANNQRTNNTKEIFPSVIELKYNILTQYPSQFWETKLQEQIHYSFSIP